MEVLEVTTGYQFYLAGMLCTALFPLDIHPILGQKWLILDHRNWCTSWLSEGSILSCEKVQS